MGIGSIVLQIKTDSISVMTYLQNTPVTCPRLLITISEEGNGT